MAELMQKIVRWMDAPIRGPKKWRHGNVIVHLLKSPDDIEHAPSTAAEPLDELYDPSPRRFDKSARKAEAIETIHRDGPFTTAELAAAVGCSPDTVIRYFDERTMRGSDIMRLSHPKIGSIWMQRSSIDQRIESAKKSGSMAAEVYGCLGSRQINIDKIKESLGISAQKVDQAIWILEKLALVHVYGNAVKRKTV